MKQSVKQVWKKIKEFDAEIRTIEHQSFKEENEPDYFLVEVGLFESLGETGGDILTIDFDHYPLEEEIKQDIKEHLINLKNELHGLILSDRQEKQKRVLNKIKF